MTPEEMARKKRNIYMRNYMREYRKVKKENPNVELRSEKASQIKRGNTKFVVLDMQTPGINPENGNTAYRSPAQAIYQKTAGMTAKEARQWTKKFWEEYKSITDDMYWADIDSSAAFDAASGLVEDEEYQYPDISISGTDDLRAWVLSNGWKIKK